MPTDPGILTTVLNAFLTMLSGGWFRILPDSMYLLATMSTIELVLFSLWYTFGEGKAIDYLKKIMFISFLFWVIQMYPSLATMTINSFIAAGLKMGGSAYAYTDFADPSKVIDLGILACQPMLDSMSIMSPGQAIVNGLVYVIAILSFFIIAIQIFIGLMEFYIIALASLILLPWGAFKQTSFISEKVFGSVISHSAKLMMLAIIFSAAMPVLSSLSLPADPTIKQSLSILVAAMAIAMLSMSAPAIAAGLISGGPSMTAGTFAGTANTLAGGAIMAGMAAKSIGSSAFQATNAAAGAIAQGAGFVSGAYQTGAALQGGGGGGGGGFKIASASALKDRFSSVGGGLKGVASATGGAVASAASNIKDNIAGSASASYKDGFVKSFGATGGTLTDGMKSQLTSSQQQSSGRTPPSWVKNAQHLSHLKHKLSSVQARATSGPSYSG